MTTRTPNTQLADAVATTGLTYDSVARRVRAVAAECGTKLRTNKSTVAHWLAGTPPAPATARYLAIALSRHTGRLLTPADLGLADPEDDEEAELSMEADPIDVLLPLWRNELERRRFLAAYSVAAAALPLSSVREAAERTAIARSGAAPRPAASSADPNDSRTSSVATSAAHTSATSWTRTL